MPCGQFPLHGSVTTFSQCDAIEKLHPLGYCRRTHVFQPFDGLSSTEPQLIRHDLEKVPSQGPSNLDAFAAAFNAEEIHEVSSTRVVTIAHLRVSKRSDHNGLAAIESRKRRLPVMASCLCLYPPMLNRHPAICDGQGRW